MRGPGPVLAGVVAVWLLAACASASGSSQILISGAASLTDVLGELAEAYQAGNEGVETTLNLGASSALREQILAGAEVDLFAPASIRDMELVQEAGLVVGQPATFATNRLVIAVQEGNPAGITGLEDFADPGLLLGLCAPGAPCGDLAREALASAGVAPSIDTEEPDVRALLTRVATGELDAGIVYATELAAAPGRVEGVEIPERHNRVAVYQMAVIVTSADPGLGEDLIELVLSTRGEEILSRWGFLPP